MKTLEIKIKRQEFETNFNTLNSHKDAYLKEILHNHMSKSLKKDYIINKNLTDQVRGMKNRLEDRYNKRKNEKKKPKKKLNNLNPFDEWFENQFKSKESRNRGRSLSVRKRKKNKKSKSLTTKFKMDIFNIEEGRNKDLNFNEIKTTSTRSSFISF